MDTAQIEKLFIEYEKAFNDLDVKRNAEFFSDTFISAGPKGTIAQNKKDFLQKAEQASAFYKSVGQTSAKIISKNIIPISDQYTMVTVHWGVTFKRTGNKLIEFDISYIVYQPEEEPSIIMFIAHQDEEEAMKKLGLLNELKPA
ncbi:MAG TPA: nuclear transport factor 2 family protein [Chitinophagaceae bacterium]|jgi:hypothetical protein|nr:nuclear transport factor 2 family protein [Chitinophagaceae bacterium]